MIKTGQSIKDTVGVLNQELPTKVNKSTTIAGIPLTSSISKYSLMRKLFVVQEETYASSPQEQQDFFNNKILLGSTPDYIPNPFSDLDDNEDLLYEPVTTPKGVER